MVLDDAPTNEKLDDSVYMVTAARDVWRTINFLEAGSVLPERADELAATLPKRLAAAMLDRHAHRACVLALRQWLGPL
jgi:hypothetical protein